MALLAVAFSVQGDEQTERRILVGVQLFPAVATTDLELEGKRSADGRLHLAVLHRDAPQTAAAVAQRLRAVGAMREMPVSVEVVAFADLPNLAVAPPAALFLAESSSEDLHAAVAFGRTHRRLVFSPFYGDVSQGAHAGIFIGPRILPLINPASLEAARIRLKPFLLEIAETRE